MADIAKIKDTDKFETLVTKLNEMIDEHNSLKSSLADAYKNIGDLETRVKNLESKA